MKLRTKFLFAYIVAFFVSLIVLNLVAIIMFNFEKKSTETFNEQRNIMVQGNLLYLANQEPQRLLDKRYLNSFKQDFLKSEYQLLIIRDQKLLYATPQLKQKYEQYKGNLNQVLLHMSDYNKLLEHRFSFSSHSNGLLFLFSTIKLRPWYNILFFILVVGVGLLSIHFTLSFFVRRMIINPVDTLKMAAQHIQAGDLNFQVHQHTNDELGELSQAFEEMRLRLKTSIEQQQKIEQNRRELVANISHDLRSPIATIKGYTEGILKGIAHTPKQQMKYLQIIYQRLDELDQLIDQLFFYSKLDLQQVPFHFEKVDIDQYLQNFLLEMDQVYKHEQIKVHYRYFPKYPIQVMMDPLQINRVCNNIVDNSLKYSNKGDLKIEITVHELADQVQICFQDNGPGIDPNTLPQIFERFYRGDPSRNRKIKGSGLGLSIAKQIVEEHQGTISASSKPNRGTTILFTLKKWKGANDA